MCHIVALSKGNTFGNMVRVMMFIATFNNMSVISWRSVLLVEETGVPWENHRPVVSLRQTWSHNIVSKTPRHERVRTHNVSGDRHWLHRYNVVINTTTINHDHDGPHLAIWFWYYNHLWEMTMSDILCFTSPSVSFKMWQKFVIFIHLRLLTIQMYKCVPFWVMIFCDYMEKRSIQYKRIKTL
jgi:hypothetical protein